MNKIILSWVAMVPMALLVVTPAAANTAADLKTCRSALVEKGLFNTAEHSLKFSHRKGNSRNRTIYFDLKHKNDSDRQQVTCKINRKDVIDLSVAD